ncbi:hypothetical protein [Streptomyces melanogenes]|uniref:hypothetical protein n=1 Tax=Streptomyces melanogenes TaxID=67326 RepID=UPI00167E8D14|nr:hypothetical protein [Streptomyces melanogenes]
MEIARLVLDFIKVLAWPLVTVFAAHVFRADIQRLFLRVRTLSAPGIDAEFSEEVAETNAEVEAAVRRGEEAGSASDNLGVHAPRRLGRGGPTLDSLLATAATNPDMAIMGSWRALEQVIYDVTQSVLDTDQSARAATMLRALNLPPYIKDALDRLRRVRNEVTHERGGSASPGTAADYVHSCDAMAVWLERHGPDLLLRP